MSVTMATLSLKTSLLLWGLQSSNHVTQEHLRNTEAQVHPPQTHYIGLDILWLLSQRLRLRSRLQTLLLSISLKHHCSDSLPEAQLQPQHLPPSESPGAVEMPWVILPCPGNTHPGSCHAWKTQAMKRSPWEARQSLVLAAPGPCIPTGHTGAHINQTRPFCLSGVKT